MGRKENDLVRLKLGKTPLFRKGGERRGKSPRERSNVQVAALSGFKEEPHTVAKEILEVTERVVASRKSR